MKLDPLSPMLAVMATSLAPALSCDTWVALPDATADGSVILAKNSDRPPMEAQPLVQVPRRQNPSGDMVQCTYLAIPQAAETYEHLGSKLWWAFGYEHGMNEHGVAIGNEAVWSKEPYQRGDGLLGMDLVRLGLERGRTAYDAMHVIIDLLEKYGQCGDCERAGEWGDANYHNSFILADPKEAWVLETAGRYWVAKRVARGVYSISNIYSIEKDWDEAHPRLVAHALEKGWCRSAESFNFARDYGDYWSKDSKAPGSMQLRRNMTLSCLQKDLGHITPSTMVQISRSHLEGTLAQPRWAAVESFWATPCMHDSPAKPYHTAASMVAHLRPKMPPLLRQVYWASFSNPCCNVFQPFYLQGPTIPQEYAKGASTYSPDAPWWRANRLTLLCALNYNALAPAVRSVFAPVENWERERQINAERQAQRQLQVGKSVDAAGVLQEFINQNCRRLDREYLRLNDSLPATLKTAGLQYLFTDYVREWTSKAGVPLPLASEAYETSRAR